MAEVTTRKTCMRIDISTFAEIMYLEDDVTTIERTELIRELLNANYSDKSARCSSTVCISIHKKDGSILVVHYVIDTELVLNTFVDKSIKPCNCKKGNFIHSFHGAIIISKYKDKKQVDITMEDLYYVP